jgi:hypothetical protein
MFTHFGQQFKILMVYGLAVCLKHIIISCVQSVFAI